MAFPVSLHYLVRYISNVVRMQLLGGGILTTNGTYLEKTAEIASF